MNFDHLFCIKERDQMAPCFMNSVIQQDLCSMQQNFDLCQIVISHSG